MAKDSGSTSTQNDTPRTTKNQRHSLPGKRTRKDNGPEVLNVEPVDPPTPQELGTAHLYAHEVLAGGPRALVAAQHEAARLSKRFGEEIETRWCLATPWLYNLAASNRERAKYALMWRPRFLAVMSLTRSTIFACKAARISRPTVDLHRRDDPDFDSQVMMAQDHATELLHDVTMKEAIEGRAEPVFWQGIPVGHIIKTDNRLRIEMLRAHMPKTFKSPSYGGNVSVNMNPGPGGLAQTNIIVDAQTRDDLVALRQEALKQIAAGRIPEKPADAVEVPMLDP